MDDGGLASDLRIVHAIAALQGLRSLAVYTTSIDGTSARAPTLLREVCAPLRVLSLQGYNGKIHRWNPTAVDDFNLSRLAPTLEKLELSQFIIDAEEVQTHGVVGAPSIRIAAQYPAVRPLFVGYLRETPLLDRLHFPAPDGTLSISLPPSHLDPHLDKHTDIRVANRRAQECSRSGAWKKLDRIVCDPLTLYLLGLRCPIRHVLLDASVVLLQPCAAEALRENPVSRLIIKPTLRHDDAFMLRGVFSPELAETLTHLTLLLTHEFAEAWPDPLDTVRPPLWGDVMKATISSLWSLHKLMRTSALSSSPTPAAARTIRMTLS